ncbi:hypothetical protein BC832DRAFT_280219 [Gaertneriomyces semiglobifer]|nr:hypothetical protein BC832DRAFT_280219 [Gaertneriomyces semiglobifer]
MMTAQVKTDGRATRNVNSRSSLGSNKLCHICGDMFAKATLPAHQRTCVKKRLTRSPKSDSNRSASNVRSVLYPSENQDVYSASSISTRTGSTRSAFTSFELDHDVTSSYGNRQSASYTYNRRESLDQSHINHSQTVSMPYRNEQNSMTARHASPVENRFMPKKAVAGMVTSNTTHMSFHDEDVDYELSSRFTEAMEYHVPPAVPVYAEDGPDLSLVDEGMNAMPVNRHPCPHCNRKFAEDRLEKHAAACAKVQKPRKVFDTSKARVKGTELEQYARKPKDDTKASDVIPQKKSNWRHKHEKFLQIVRSAREPASKQSTHAISEPDPDLVPCDHCGRRFNPDTAARHIPFCRDSKQKAQYRSPTKSAAKTASTGASSKEDMLKKRTAYKPPPPKLKAHTSVK